MGTSFQEDHLLHECLLPLLEYTDIFFPWSELINVCFSPLSSYIKLTIFPLPWRNLRKKSVFFLWNAPPNLGELEVRKSAHPVLSLVELTGNQFILLRNNVFKMDFPSSLCSRVSANKTQRWIFFHSSGFLFYLGRWE